MYNFISSIIVYLKIQWACKKNYNNYELGKKKIAWEAGSFGKSSLSFASKIQTFPKIRKLDSLQPQCSKTDMYLTFCFSEHLMWISIVCTSVGLSQKSSTSFPHRQPEHTRKAGSSPKLRAASIRPRRHRHCTREHLQCLQRSQDSCFAGTRQCSPTEGSVRGSELPQPTPGGEEDWRVGSESAREIGEEKIKEWP